MPTTRIIPSVENERANAGRDGRTRSRDQILRRERGQGNILFPVRLNTREIANHTRLIHTLPKILTIHTYLYILELDCISITISISISIINSSVCGKRGAHYLYWNWPMGLPERGSISKFLELPWQLKVLCRGRERHRYAIA